MYTVADIFISYSRQDSAFVEQLSTALTSRGRSVWVDTSDIAPTSVWRQDIVNAIEAASAVLFVLSPYWLASEVSQRELQYAVNMHKKLVPVVHRDVDHQLVHPALAEINWILARPSDNPEGALERILFAVDTDLGYWRQGGDLLAKASQWNEGKRQPAYTLRGEALRKAEQWLAEGASKRPAPSELQIEYITAGRRAAAARQRTTIGALSVGIIITLILSIVASTLAVTNQRQNVVLTAQNIKLARGTMDNEARAQYNGNKIDLAVLLAAAAYKEGPADDAATRNALFSLVHQSPHLDTILQNTSNASIADVATYIGYSADGNTLAYVNAREVTVKYATGSRPQIKFSPPPAPTSPNPSILGAALSSDGTLIALKTEDVNNGSHITLWSTTTGKEVRQLDGITYELNIEQHGLAFSPDGRFLASAICPDPACNTTQFTIWNVNTGKVIAQIPGEYSIGTAFGDSVSFSADSRYAAFSESANDEVARAAGRVVVFDLQQDAPTFVLNNTNQITTVSFTPAPDIMAVASVAGTLGQLQQVAFWNIVKQTQVGPVTTIDDLNVIQTVEFDSQGIFMLTADSDHTINLWEIDTSYATVLLTEDFTTIRSVITAVAFSLDGTRVATASEDGQINIWRLAPFTSASPDAKLTLLTQPYVAYSPDSQSLLFNDDLTSTIDSWNMTQGTAGQSLEVPPGSAITQLAVSHDGTRVAVVTTSGELTTISRTTGSVEGSPWTSPLSVITSLEFSPDGRNLLACGFTASYREVCLLWDAASHMQVESFGQVSPTEQYVQGFFSAGFSPDGKSIAFGTLDIATGTSEIEVFNVAEQKVAATLQLGQLLPLVIHWSADSHFVGYLADSGNIALWNPTAGPHQIQVTKLQSGSFFRSTFQFIAAPPGTDSKSLWIMAASGRSVGLWRIDQQGTVSTYLDPLYFDNTILSAGVSPNGKYLAVAEYGSA